MVKKETKRKLTDASPAPAVVPALAKLITELEEKKIADSQFAEYKLQVVSELSAHVSRAIHSESYGELLATLQAVYSGASAPVASGTEEAAEPAAKKPKKAPKDVNAPSKPTPVYFLFQHTLLPYIVKEHPSVPNQARSKLVKAGWDHLSEALRAKWNDIYKERLLSYKQDFADFESGAVTFVGGKKVGADGTPEEESVDYLPGLEDAVKATLSFVRSGTVIDTAIADAEREKESKATLKEEAKTRETDDVDSEPEPPKKKKKAATAPAAPATPAKEVAAPPAAPQPVPEATPVAEKKKRAPKSATKDKEVKEVKEKKTKAKKPTETPPAKATPAKKTASKKSKKQKDDSSSDEVFKDAVNVTPTPKQPKSASKKTPAPAPESDSDSDSDSE